MKSERLVLLWKANDKKLSHCMVHNILCTYEQNKQSIV